ncbi:protealysin inhibitor emfourin [Specibacter sp. NPDC057265]|uniref:protealysin inhibitor emfourin n=1 Tax=Specibacter sp. NPDC057265 TaxID=3346075 RepID=UPI0036453460
MKLTIRRGGGLAGIVAQTELDAQKLPQPAAEAFAGEVARAELQLQPPPPPPPASRWADAQLYEISLEEAGPPVCVHFTDETLPENVRQLMAWVDGRPERTESIGY